jgi:octaprenyl-diphosphate synthase
LPRDTPLARSRTLSVPAESAPRPQAAAKQQLLDVVEQRPALPPGSQRFFALVAEKLAATEEVFRRNLASDVPFIDQAGKYLATGGGKRVRPALLLLSARMLGLDGEEEITYAATVELIHTATLVHDDIIDHAALRRGRTTVNHLWGNHLTVLLGDWMYTTSMQMALSHGHLEVVQRLCSATLKMVEGELLALQRLSDPRLTEDEYFDVIERKTAHLFAAAASIPSLVPNPDPPCPREAADRALTRYGRQLGVCFQLVDDLLDFTARELELGKPVLSDLKEGKLTLPLLLLMPRVPAEDRRKVERVLEDRAFERVQPAEILELVRREGTVDEVRAMAESYAAEAKEALAELPPGDARDALELAPEFVLDRRS